MMRFRKQLVPAVVSLSILASCARPEERPAARREGPAIQPITASTEHADAARVEREMEALRHRIVERGDSVRQALLAVRGLTRAERAELRRDVNATQIAVARNLGVLASGESAIDRLVRQGRLVELEDSTQYWVLRDLEHSVPFVTPDTRSLLAEIGRRFHERLDSLGLPRYRLEVTSVLRTAESQADLRRRNSNAASGVSAHQFGTTLDIAHSRFAAPEELIAEVSSDPSRTEAFRMVEALVLEEVARRHGVGLQAELGRVLREMRQEGKLRVMMERRQAVYHLTVARRIPAGLAVD